MSLGKLLRVGAVAAAVLLGLQLDASADPITYEGTLTSGVPFAQDIGPSTSFSFAPDAEYFAFWAEAGNTVQVRVDRIDYALDPALFVYKGVFLDTFDPRLAGPSNNLFDGTNLKGWGDDEIPVPGPYMDPLVVFTAGTTGWYTAAVTEFWSDKPPADGEYDFAITVKGITGLPPGAPPVNMPEPGLLALLACGVCGVALTRRRKSN